MKQENKKNSSYNKIRNNLYANVKRHELTERKTFSIVALSALVLASILLFVAAMIESGSKKEYIYVFGDTEQELSEKLAFSDGVQYIDMSALASFAVWTTWTADLPSTARLSALRTEITPQK